MKSYQEQLQPSNSQNSEQDSKQERETITPVFSNNLEGTSQQNQQEFFDSEDNQGFVTPELNLKMITVSARETNQQFLSNTNLIVEKTAPSPLFLNEIKNLEQSVTTFLNQEIKKLGLFTKLNSANQQVTDLLNEIKFFAQPSAYLTGFFGSGFSREDQKKWSKIEEILDTIYDSDNGIIKKVQDHFLFQISGDQLARLFQCQNPSLEEELFLRSILVKSYLNNLRQLIIPFYNLSDDFLVKFKRERIQNLKQVQTGDDNHQQEITLLQQQIENLQSQHSTINNQQLQSQRSFQISAEKISAGNLELNTGSVVVGSVETVRYVTSYVGHQTGSSFLKQVGSFFFKAGSTITKMLPVVSTVAEAGTQLNNNRIVYNYEKRLRSLSLIETVKRNLLIHEQRVNDYYITSILGRLQEIIINKQQQTQRLIIHAKNQQLIITSDSEKALDKQLEVIKNNYYQNVDTVRKQVINGYQQTLASKNQQITDKQAVISTLDQQLFITGEKNAQTEREQQKTIFRLQREVSQLEGKKLALQQQVDNHQQELVAQQNILETNQQIANEAVSGQLTDQLGVSYEREVQRRQELEKYVFVLLKKQHEFEAQISNLQAEASTNQTIHSQDEELAIINEKLVTDLQEAKRNLQRLKELQWKLEEDNSQLTDQLAVLRADCLILLDAKEKLGLSIDNEIEKCNRYRAEIEQLQNTLIETEEAYQTRHERERQLANSLRVEQEEKIRELTTKLAEYIEILNKAKGKIEKLEQRSFYEQVKLTTVLLLDSSRPFLPEKAGVVINWVETAILAHQINSWNGCLSWWLGVAFFSCSVAFSSYKIVDKVVKNIYWTISKWKKEGGKEIERISKQKQQLKSAKFTKENRRHSSKK